MNILRDFITVLSFYLINYNIKKRHFIHLTNVAVISPILRNNKKIKIFIHNLIINDTAIWQKLKTLQPIILARKNLHILENLLTKAYIKIRIINDIQLKLAQKAAHRVSIFLRASSEP